MKRRALGMRIALGMLAALAALDLAIDDRLPGPRARWVAGSVVAFLVVWPVVWVSEGDWAGSVGLALLVTFVAVCISSYLARRVEQHPIGMSADRTPEWDWIMRHTRERDRLRKRGPNTDGCP